MSRLFSGGTDRMTQGTVGLPATGTLAMWVYPTWAQTDGVRHFWYHQVIGADVFEWEHFTNNELFFGWVVGTDHRVTVSSYTLNQNAWNLLVETWDDVANASTLYLNNTQIGSWNTLVTNTGTGTRYIGNSDASAAVAACRIAEVALWNRVITSTERSNLNSFYRAIDTAPSGLLDYLPLLGTDSPEPNLAGGTVGTLTGTTQAAHPPMLTGIIPVIMGHRRSQGMS
jgi:Concanavalin A-like lectin/glucanases superfamily